MVEVPDGEARSPFNEHQQDLSRALRRSGRACREEGDFVIPGVSGSGAKITLDYLDPGAATSCLLPSGTIKDRLHVPGLGPVEASLIDASNPVVFVSAKALDADITATPEALERDAYFMARMDAVRRAGAVAMGMAASPEQAGLANPKVAIVGSPTAFTAIDG